MINAIKFSIEEIEASDQYFDYTGFRWPRGRQNFSRWFRVSTDADVDALAEFSLGILNNVFGHNSGNDLALTVQLP